MKRGEFHRASAHRLVPGWRWGLALGTLLASLALAALRICPGCGTEALSEEAVCRHCGAGLPVEAPAVVVEPAAETPPDAAATNRVSPQTLTMEMARAEEGQARARWERGDWPGALLWGRNAVAWYSAQGADGLLAAAKLDVALTGLRRAALLKPRSCPACEGSGVRRIQIVKLSGEIIERDAPGAACPACRGRGSLSGRLTPEEIESVRATAMTSFALLQRQKGREEWTGIWLPVGLSGSLSTRQIVAFRKGFGALCPDCLGFGRSGCESCGGTGFTACRNSGCVQGTEICPDCGGIGRLKGSANTNSMILTCPGCKGSGRRSCPACEGRGLMECGDCEGKGEILCRRCKGIGHPAACVRCGGAGLADCTRCGGTGLDRGAACAACKTEGVIPCRSCTGTGVSAK